MAITEQIRSEYFNALYNQQFGNNEPMKRFKGSFPNEYRLINNVYHARTKLLHDIGIMKRLSNNSIYWGTLTYNEDKDKNLIKSKRKEAEKHLNELFCLWVMVEEFGTDNGRYHIHFIGVFKFGKTFNDFFQWHSKKDIEKVYNARKVARYLCDYMTKQMPRIRRNKNMIKYSKEYKTWQNMSKIGFQYADSKIAEIDFLATLELMPEI